MARLARSRGVGDVRVSSLLALLAMTTALMALSGVSAIQTIAGTDTFSDLASALLKGFKRVPDAYETVGSQSAITSFNSNGVAIAVSDEPMAQQQELMAGTTAKAYGRYTLPLVMGTYGFFVNAPAKSVVQLTALQTWQIYTVGGLWPKYGVGLTGPIVRYARGDSCGANLVMKKYWARGAKAPVPLDEGPLIYPDVVYVTGAKAMCDGLLSKPGGIAYGLTGLCMPYVQAGKLVEVAMQQGNGAFILPSRSRPATAIPKNLPPTWLPWTAVPDQLMFSKGKLAPPIVVFEYALFRRKGLRLTGRQGVLAREFLLYMVQTAPLLARTYGFLPVPPAMVTKNIVAVRAVTLY